MSRIEGEMMLKGVEKGCGDGRDLEGKKRIPVTSSRKFGLERCKVSGRKEQLKKAIQEMSTRVPEARFQTKTGIKRTATIAEISPSLRLSLTKDRPLDKCGSPAKGASAASAEGAASPRRQASEAARTMYQLLLLNSWRRRRSQVQTLTESCEQLSKELNNMSRKNKCLVQLRESEVIGRDQAVAEMESVREKLTEAEAEIKTLQEEQRRDREIMSRLDAKCSQLQLMADDLAQRNQVILAEKSAVDQSNEKLCIALHNAKRLLKEQEQKQAQLELEINKKIFQLGEIVKMTEDDLQNQRQITAEMSEESDANYQRCQRLKVEMDTLQCNLENSCRNEESLKFQNDLLKLSLEEKERDNVILEVQNHELAEKLYNADMELRNLKNRAFLKRMQRLANASRGSLYDFFSVMLPAIPARRKQ